jgi:serpin B
MLEEQMTPNRFADLYKGIKPEVILSLPKFKMTLPLKLKAQLKAMGMKLSFETGANFSKMTEQAKLHVSEVIHKAFIEVDEKGTEAAAATAVVMAVTSSISHDDRPLPKVFNADHPFLIYILDDQTQSILFMGRVMNPTAS